jgi:integrase
MGVKIRKRDGKWYVFVNYRGRRKAKCVGTSRELAEQVRRQLEAKLALGDLGFLAEEEQVTFGKYADRWLKQHAELHCKPSTISGYKAVLRLRVRPTFEHVSVDRISRDDVKELFTNLSAKGLSANTLKNALIILRVVLNSAIGDGLIQANPANKMGRFLPADPEKFEPVALIREEAESFLAEVDADFHLLFLTLLRTGMRWGEAAALRWGDIQFGSSEEDPNRFIWVRRNWVQGKFTSPKSKKTRRIDLSRQLRRALLETRDARILKAYLGGRSRIADELVFPSEAGTVLDHSNVYSRYFLPAIERAGLRHFRIHDLRHTFASQLLQDGASLAYVRDQLGHSSISVTVDLYGHLVASANIAWVDRLDSEISQQQNATPAQLNEGETLEDFAEVADNGGGPGRSRTADQRFRKPLLYPTELRGHCDVAPLCHVSLPKSALPRVSTRAANLMAALR